MSWRSSVKIALLTAAGRNPLGSLQEALDGWDRSVKLNEEADRLAKASQLIQSENAFHCWQTPLGTYWTTGKPDPKTLSLVLVEQNMSVYERRSPIQRGDIVLDCGGNIGAFSVHALKKGAAKLLAFEPSAANAECLRRNTEQFGDCINIARCGVWDKKDELTLLIDTNNPGGNSFITHNSGSKPGPRVPLTTIDSAVTEYALPRVDFIKIDIEAAETAALRGAEQTIRKYHPRMAVAVEHTRDRLGNARAVIEIVREFHSGYKIGFDLFYLSDRNQLLPEVIQFY